MFQLLIKQLLKFEAMKTHISFLMDNLASLLSSPLILWKYSFNVRLACFSLYLPLRLNSVMNKLFQFSTRLHDDIFFLLSEDTVNNTLSWKQA